MLISIEQTGGVMSNIEKLRIWKETLGKNDNKNMEHIKTLKEEYLKIYENAGKLADNIKIDYPHLTIHDKVHLYSVWEMADILCPEEFLNPLEAFVFGCSICLHDIGLTISSYEDGFKEIIENTIFKDYYCLFYKDKHNTTCDIKTIKDFKTCDNEVLKNAIQKTLRINHSSISEKIVNYQVQIGDTKKYIIENDDIRDNLGELIGEIAHSHHWDTQDVVSKFKKSEPTPTMFPHEWELNSLKIALLLRVCDAAHIDDRRADFKSMEVQKPEGYSKLHWIAQNKLNRPTIANYELIYKSKNPFYKEDSDAWWICKDLLTVIDDELKKTNIEYKKYSIAELKAHSIAGISKNETLSEYITTDGWIPDNSEIKITDIKKMVDNFSGTKLYGEDYYIPIRELVANANDAVKARKYLERKDNLSFGKIVLNDYEKDGNYYFVISDNGCGMDKKTITDVLLNFGKSFWDSEELIKTHSGLMSKNVNPYGKFGIGFFSIFMLSKNIEVITRSYEKSPSDTLKLEFSESNYLTPILSYASEDGLLYEAGTKITIKLEKPLHEYLKINKEAIFHYYRHRFMLNEIDIYYIPIVKELKLVVADKWKFLEKEAFIEYFYPAISHHSFKELYMEYFSHFLCDIKNHENIQGRICFFPTENEFPLPSMSTHYNHVIYDGSIYVQGLYVNKIQSVFGVLEGTANALTRFDAIPIVNEKIPELFEEYCNKIESFKYKNLIINDKPLFNKKFLYILAQKLKFFGKEPTYFPIVKHNKKYLSMDEILSMDIPDVIFYTHENPNEIPSEELRGDEYEIYKHVFFGSYTYNNTFFIKGTNVNLWEYIPDEQDEFNLLPDNIYKRYSRNLLGYFLKVLSIKWNCSLEDILKNIDYSYGDVKTQERKSSNKKFPFCKKNGTEYSTHGYLIKNPKVSNIGNYRL